MRVPMDNRLTNINVMLTKMGLAECVDKAIYDGEGTAESAAPIVLDRPLIAPNPAVPKAAMSRYALQQHAAPEQIKLLRDVCSVLGQPNKAHSERPHSSVVCRVTCALSPYEIWLQDIVDVDAWYQRFQNELAEK